MSGPITIRPVTRQDFDQWLPLWDGYNAFYGRSDETALPNEITEMTWSRFFDAYEPMDALVAESRGDTGSKGQLLGLVHYLYHRSTTAIAPNCYLQDLFTSEASRGKGVGRALINGVYDRAKAAGSGRVYWLTHETNHRAMKLYDKVGERSGFVVYRKLF
ncbi:GNAT family N-acetyltransferase [Mesorhizobium sp. AR10]|uniref:GNAT family N-acetyltransferase n=1 Tax=Mesorhizobium sp. AR10 TaxID=2865839 RepID=UPI00215EA956|nr:GNAT family N-acetyltransferase [Mesorhizobium sp. AR10]UVK38304.1 GNAT family N-acetyltransferase [Mesorhizobium sp. AR10]